MKQRASTFTDCLIALAILGFVIFLAIVGNYRPDVTGPVTQKGSDTGYHKDTYWLIVQGKCVYVTLGEWQLYELGDPYPHPETSGD